METFCKFLHNHVICISNTMSPARAIYIPFHLSLVPRPLLFYVGSGFPRLAKHGVMFHLSLVGHTYFRACIGGARKGKGEGHKIRMARETSSNYIL